MSKQISFWISILLLAFTLSGLAQNRIPREYVPEEELISLNSDLDFPNALDLLSEYAIQFSGKPIHDPKKHTMNIGIDIKSLPWRKALELILSRHGLWYVEKPHFFEIAKPSADKDISAYGNSIKLADNSELHLGAREVKIEAIFFEGDRKILREIGIDWSTFYEGELDITADQMGALSLTEDFVNLDVRIPEKVFGVDVDVLLKAFDSKNIGKVLAQPQIMVVEGKSGKIQVGQDFSVKQQDFAGNVTDRFYSTGTIMDVTPYILTDNDNRNAIFLQIHVERSQAYPDVVSTIVKKSEANSYVQLYDGEETLIGGLYSSENSTLRKGIPILKDLPWWFLGLKYLFSYNREEVTEKELVILIKATLLPKVFTREDQSKLNSSNKKARIPELEFRQMQKPSSNLDNVTPNLKTIESNQQPEKTIVLKNRQDDDENNKPVSFEKMEQKSAQLYQGTIIKLENNLALIEWKQRFDPKKLIGEQLNVLRKNNTEIGNGFKIVGKVKILKFSNNLSAAQKLNNGETNAPEILVGDRVLTYF